MLQLTQRVYNTQALYYWQALLFIIFKTNILMVNHFDVIIIGGSYAGMSAALALGRSLRSVLVIDSGKPCNKQTPHAHNFLTQDGEKPAHIAAKAREQLKKYLTIHFIEDKAETAYRQDGQFFITTLSEKEFSADKCLFATGVLDIMPDITGFAECWGISILHCPYCHGYEVHKQKTGILANGDMAFEFSRFISNWTSDLTLFTNGTAILSEEQKQKMKEHKISIVETPIKSIVQEDGQIKEVILQDGSTKALSVLYAKPSFQQHCHIPEMLGCALTEAGYIQVDEFQKTNIPGIYAAGDNTTMFRSLSAAIAAGNKAGAFINHELIHERF